MSSLEPLGFGIIGTGVVADLHARAIQESDGGRLAGCADRQKDKADRFAAKYGIGFATDQWERLVSRPDVHVVCITTPSGAHLEPALGAIQAGKHVVIEKPLEINLTRIDVLLNAAKAKGLRVAGIFQNRFGPGAQLVKAAIGKGRFGRLALCSAYIKWRRPEEYYRNSWHGTSELDGGGVLMNQGIHGVDLLQWFAGMPAEVSAWTARRVHAGIECEDTVAATMLYDSGALGAIEASTACYPGWERRIEICGEHGSIALEDDSIVRWDFQEPQAADAAVVRSAAAAPGGSAQPAAIGHRRHLLQIQDIIDAIREGRPFAVEGADSRHAVAVVRAIYESALSGRSVRVAGL